MSDSMINIKPELSNEFEMQLDDEAMYYARLKTLEELAAEGQALEKEFQKSKQ